MQLSLVFPHQLFKKSPAIRNGVPVYVVEEFLFFRQYKFHKQKLAFHRASMRFYHDYLLDKGLEVHYVESAGEDSDIRVLIEDLAKEGFKVIHCIDPTDNWLERRIASTAVKVGIELKWYSNPSFINAKEDLGWFFKPHKKKFFQTQFYKHERQKLKILMDEQSKPVGGKWSFDAENRKKYPKNQDPPEITFPQPCTYTDEAKSYVNEHFADHPGDLGVYPLYPINFEESQAWLSQFLKIRFQDFGVYEDAIVREEYILNHSVLSPIINAGLLSPLEVITKALGYSEENNIPINSVEGFVRQIIGWREFIRGVYECVGSKERLTNYWGFKRKIPATFYNGTTGIDPVDQTIKKVLETGYCHHIERLMILGNFMLLCEFDPDEVYRWFMELFIDAYDWVMVPNVYGMSQFADGGMMSTKPYISGSNYILKMSDYKKGPWQQIWDGLFWRFMHVHRTFFLSNPRLSMLIRTLDRMTAEKRNMHFALAESYLRDS